MGTHLLRPLYHLFDVSLTWCQQWVIGNQRGVFPLPDEGGALTRYSRASGCVRPLISHCNVVRKPRNHHPAPISAALPHRDTNRYMIHGRDSNGQIIHPLYQINSLSATMDDIFQKLVGPIVLGRPYVLTLLYSRKECSVLSSTIESKKT